MGRAPTGAGDDGQILPDPIAARRLEAAEFAVAVDPVEIIAVEQRRADNRVERVGLLLGGASAPPDFLHRQLVGQQSQHQRAVEEAGDEEGMVGDDRCGDGGLVGEAAPALLAALAIEGDQAGVLAADVDDDQVLVDNRRGGDAPNGHADIVIGVEVALPGDLAAGRVVGVQIAHGAEGVGQPLADDDAGARAGGIADVAVCARVLVRPDGLAGLRVEAVDALDLLGFG